MEKRHTLCAPPLLIHPPTRSLSFFTHAGKTAVFSMGILQRLDTTSNDTQALVLSPTRELAEQTQKVILSLGDYMNVQCHACIGGKSIGEVSRGGRRISFPCINCLHAVYVFDCSLAFFFFSLSLSLQDIRRLDYGVQVVSGTPGRVFDMIRRRNLKTKCLKMLVIDEADEMLNKGFKEQIYDIYRYLPPTTQVVLISATLPQEVLDMTKKFMNEPIKVLVKRDELTLEG